MTSLQSLHYHQLIAGLLEAAVPEAWEAMRTGVPESVDDLLRGAYKLEPESHPYVYGAAQQAAAELEITVPVSLWQMDSSSDPNASLVFTSGEVIVALSGNLLDVLSPGELAAVLGHEIAHHVLWSIDDGRYLVADRVLSAFCLEAATPLAYLETARRFSLATELFADRGSLAACGDLRTAVAALLKTAPGLGEVDPVAYLRQAAEARPGRSSDASAHPETIVRTWALGAWSQQSRDDDADDRSARTVLQSWLDIERLDVFDQQTMLELTRAIISDYVGDPLVSTPAVKAHAADFFPDLSGRPNSEVRKAFTVPRTEATDSYLSYVLLDFATIDPDLDEAAIVAAIRVARKYGFDQAFGACSTGELVVSNAGYPRLAALARPGSGSSAHSLDEE